MCAAAATASSTHLSVVSLTDVPRSPDPFTKVPHYIFENCNHAISKTYDPRFLTLLKQRVVDQQAAVAMSQGETKRFEELDWIYGLVCLERDLLPQGPDYILTALTVNEVVRINGLFGRLILGEKSGKMRTRNVYWPLGTPPFTQVVAHGLFEAQIQQRFGEDFLSSRSGTPHSDKKKLLIKKSWVTNQFRQLQLQPDRVDPRDGAQDANYIQTNMAQTTPMDMAAAMQEWIAAQKRTDGKLNVLYWIEEHYHYFPLPDSISTELAATLQVIRSDAMHPIEKACRLWFEIVRLHISNEAHKRTGKALASIILLAYGYLPPKIEGEDGKEYIRILQSAFREDRGFERFMAFIVRKMQETYQEQSQVAGSGSSSSGSSAGGSSAGAASSF
ncbi:MAG: hypothetical protein S4CHLAM2_12350 [Chlamydiales bacterium]|nr:hypothetical protein [Chlamydiales bacterium]